MYRRVPYERMKKRELKRKRALQLGCGLLIAAGIGGGSFLLALKAMAAPEAQVEAAETKVPEELRKVAETISGNTVIPEIIKAERDTPLIIIDPGHGGIDEGCGKDGLWEKDINLAIAEKVKEKLDGMGFQAVMAREGDIYIAKEDRVANANACGADLYVSIHQNTYEDGTVEGIETWYDGSDSARDSRRLAQLIHKETIKSTQAVERQLRSDADFHVTGKTTMPACLIETGFLSNPGEGAKLATGEYQDQIAEGIARGIDLYFHPKTMYLTFDDGPFVENTGRVLEILKARGIKATFFLVGKNVEKNPEMARRIVEEGHTIGIHCYSHDYKAIYASVDSYLEDFERAYEVVKETTGVEAKFFRFPGGSVNAYNKKVCRAIAEEMTARGFIYYDWNASLEDAVKDPQPEQLIANAMESIRGQERVVLLAHDVIHATGMCLEELLDQLPEYRMEVLAEDMEAVHFRME